jgi:diketogulonate reductase-like aldo/keto reductase
VHKERIIEDFNVFDFELTADEMKTIHSMHWFLKNWLIFEKFNDLIMKLYYSISKIFTTK